MLLPGAILDPGSHWSYQAGYSQCLMEVWHYTVGRNSIALCRDQGLVAFLVRDEGIYQFSPSNAVNFTQCEWNRVATATEVESMDGSMSEAQLRHLQYLTMWKLTTHGIPPFFYNGPRMPVLNGYQGVTNHRNLVHQACDQHYDGFDDWVWEYVSGGTPPTPEPTPIPKGKKKMFVGWLTFVSGANLVYLFNEAGRMIHEFPQEDLNGYGIPSSAMDAWGKLPVIKMTGEEWKNVYETGYLKRTPE